MAIRDFQSYCIIFNENKVVLRGDSRNIHIEAQKIILRFQNSAKPYFITLDSSYQIELSTSD